MSAGDPFTELLTRVRSGDADAANEIVRQYESLIRVAVRTRLSDPRLRRQLDSLDVCQSVLVSFFIHAATGAYDLQEPAQLVALLTKMAQNKLAMRARSQFRQRRDTRRTIELAGDTLGLASSVPGPDQQVAGRELLDRALSMMTPDMREVAARRMEGESWANIAAALGGTADARRKQFERSISMISEALEIGAPDE